MKNGEGNNWTQSGNAVLTRQSVCKAGYEVSEVGPFNGRA